VALALAGSGRFRVRGLTRDPASAKAQPLTAAGVEMVKADTSSREGLLRAFEGAYGAFVVGSRISYFFLSLSLSFL
jgi:uncharacterized protein YbjT (DUF2867 family)